MLNSVIQRFAMRVELPIEVSEIAAAIIEEGVQDEIHFVPVEADRSQIHGAFARFRYRPRVYADPIWVTHIPYNSNDSLPWQRVTCCKELVHIFDREIECTDTEEEVPEFIEKLLGPLSTEDYGIADLMAGKDKLALYQCLPLLLPRAALLVAREAVQSGRKTVEEVAEWAQMPVGLVRMMLGEQWEVLNGAIGGVDQSRDQ
jgi:hypothetical protein